MTGCRVATQYRSVVPHGDPGNLQFQIALVAPKPWNFVVGLRLSNNIGGSAARLIDRVLHRFEAHPAGSEWCREIGAVADREDRRVGSRELFVDDDTVVDGETGPTGDFRVGDDPDAD